MHIKEVIEVDIYESNMDLPNRYDLMIKMNLSKKALEEFDNGKIHKEWKEKFGQYIINKKKHFKKLLKKVAF